MTSNSKNTPIKIERYPSTHQNNLQAWNAADELLIQYSQELLHKNSQLSIYHDRFGYLNAHLAQYQIQNVLVFHSQKQALYQNLTNNEINPENITNVSPLDQLNNRTDLAIMKMPKSVDLLEMYLQQLIPSLNTDAKVIIGFMTRHFSSKAWQLVAEYFEECTQTKALKKARLMILSKPKSFVKKELFHRISFKENIILKQYYGIFSAQKIDFATQFLLEHLTVKETDNKILDLGCGNGIIALIAQQQNPKAELHLIDDHFLAIESAKLNFSSSPTTTFHFTSDLNHFEENSFDLVVSNPPFHFEYENNIEISLNLFQQVKRILKASASFILVANRHLNYQTHLVKIFKQVEIVAQNDKFVIYRAHNE